MWVDDRIVKSVKSNILLQRELITYLWFPDPYCYNAKKSDLMLPDTDVHSVVRIDQDGHIFYSRRSVARTLHCLRIWEQGKSDGDMLSGIFPRLMPGVCL